MDFSILVKAVFIINIDIYMLDLQFGVQCGLITPLPC